MVKEIFMRISVYCFITKTFMCDIGAQGFPAWGIMPNATLTFVIEVLKIQ
jgi:hypothetical protein